MKQISLPVQGMSCASCVGHVEKAFGELPGVSHVVVNLGLGKASLMYDPTRVTMAALISAVAAVGYDVPTAEIALDVRGMTCASCVAHVERALTELDGVTGAVVNLGLGTARIAYIPGAVTIGALKQAVRDVGYEARKRGAVTDTLDRERQACQDEIRTQGRNLLVAGVIGQLVMIGTFYDMLGPFQAIVPVWLSYKWVLGLLTTPIVFGPGRQFFVNSWRGLKHGVTDMNLLYATGRGRAGEQSTHPQASRLGCWPLHPRRPPAGGDGVRVLVLLRLPAVLRPGLALYSVAGYPGIDRRVRLFAAALGHGAGDLLSLRGRPGHAKCDDGRHRQGC
jgi:Cu+-exporting ATPase